MENKLSAGSKIPDIDISLINGDSARLYEEKANWSLLVVYRGLHCPICKDYAAKFETNLSKLHDMNTQLFFVSADPIDKAKIFAEELNLKSKIGYGLTIEQMRKLGLYRSEPRPNEVDYIFPEPGLFLINPKGKIHIIELSNAPFIRPDIDLILRGINHIQKNNYPIRGTH